MDGMDEWNHRRSMMRAGLGALGTVGMAARPARGPETRSCPTAGEGRPLECHHNAVRLLGLGS